MIYTEMTKKAMRLMIEKHENQKDKAGMPYFYHPLHVAEQMNDETTTIVALLHDIVEDTDTTLDDLRNMNFPKDVLDAIDALTHKDGVDYYDYIENISKNGIARKVKIKDLEHNMDLNRLTEITDVDIKRYEKYKRCHDYLLTFEKESVLDKGVD